MPGDWDEADLHAWGEYLAKHPPSASPEVASPTGPHMPKKTTGPKKTETKR